MKKIILLCSLFTFLACENAEKKENPIPEAETTTETSETAVEEEKEELPILVGIKERDDLTAEPYLSAWFGDTYQTYNVDEALVKKVAPLLEGVQIKLFMGTWCEDSQREVPQFFKILDKVLFNEVKGLTLITVTRDKDTPDHLEEGLDITNVPTIIFYKDGKELNRIVESPVVSLEDDMLRILSGKTYKHTYAE